MKRESILLGLLCLLLSGCTCFGGLQPTKIVKHPDSPMLITSVDGNEVLVAVYQAKENRLIEYGWVNLETLLGWTIQKYDWEKFIKKKANK